MPNILALDTSSEYCSVALHSQDSHREMVSESEWAPQSHTELVLPMVHSLLKDCSLALRELDAIAFGCGPGSFTGLRIAAGVAQGLSYGLDCPVIPVSNLQAMALQRYRKGGERNVLVAIDARMDEVYWSFCKINTANEFISVQSCGGEHVSSPESLILPDEFSIPDEISASISESSSVSSTEIVAVGSGCNFIERFPVSVQQRLSVFDADARPHAAAIAELALTAINQGASGAIADAVPSYIRNKVSWKKLPGRA